MIRLSLGTAAQLGLLKMRMESLPTTAYLLHGEGCQMNCAFCLQARDAGRQPGRLGRITWPSFPQEEVVAGLQQAARKGLLQRICLQAVYEPGGSKAVAELLRRLKDVVQLPLSLSAPVHSIAEAALYFEAGAERLSIALDAAAGEIYALYKGGLLQKRLRLLSDCARLWPGRMSTHLICGLGETEAQVALLLERLVKEKITVALFAFTPLKGTPLEQRLPPEPASYRRLQALYYLLRHGHLSAKDLRFDKGRLISFGLDESKLRHLLGGGEAFQTCGCPGCNRPYFNERPGGFIYNYPRPLKQSEIAAALTLVQRSLFPWGEKSREFFYER